MGKVSENKQNKRTKILDSAWKLFSEKNINATAVDDVVRIAGVAKGTFYLYFKDKHDLLDQLLVQRTSLVLLEALSAVEKKEKEGVMTLQERVVFVTEYLISYFTENKKILAIVRKNLSACFRDILSSEDTELKRSLSSMIEGFVAYGYTEEEAKITLYLLVDAIGSVCSDAILGVGPYDMDTIRPYLYRMIHNTITR